MDSLKSLLDRKQYDLILSLTEGATDMEAVVFRISAYLGKGQGKEATTLFLANRDALWAYNPMLTLKSNFELRFIAHDYDAAYEDVSYFENKDYVSQEVEEYLRDLPKLIRMNEKNESLAKRYSPEEIDRIFKESKDDYEVLNLLNYLQGIPLTEYYGYLKEILVSSRHPSVKTYALLLLIEHGYPQAVTFTKNGKVYHLVPKELVPPYSGPFLMASSIIETLSCDPSVANVATTLLNDAIMASYPEDLIAQQEDTLLAVALISLARSYLRSTLGIQGYLDKYSLRKEDVEARASYLKSLLEKDPPLKI